MDTITKNIDVVSLLVRLERLEATVVRLERENKALRKENAELKKQLAKKDKRISRLESALAKTKKDSSNSSKSPSSDIVKPKGRDRSKASNLKRGGQKGHKRSERKPFTEDQITKALKYRLEGCPDCGGKLKAMVESGAKKIQQVEVKEKLVEVNEHQGLPYWCDNCQKIHYGVIPEIVEKSGLVGPELTAHIAFLKGFGHLSYSSLSRLLSDLYGIPGSPFSNGFLVKVIQKASEALFSPYKELEDALRLQSILNIDETGHKHNGNKFWTWCFRAELFTFFHIADTRGSIVLFDLLGEDFSGTIGCDLFSAYKKFMSNSCALVQFCIAHLIRDVRFMIGLKDKDIKDYGNRLLDEIREMFKVIHNREFMSENNFAEAMKAAKKNIIDTAINGPDKAEAKTMAKRFRKFGEEYFTFITTPGLEPTNNLAEQAIRFVVIDRLITQGTRSQKGNEWCERIWTTIGTCTQQDRSIFGFIRETIYAHFNSQPAPSLLPVNSS